jgi:hypothetical protein
MASLRTELEVHGVRDNDGLAELLVTQLLDGKRNRERSHKGFDLVAPIYGRVEVHSRTLPRHRRAETRVVLQQSKRHEFDWLAVVIFTPSLEVSAAYLLPHDAAWDLADTSKFSRIALSTALAHPSACDITKDLREARSLLAA